MKTQLINYVRAGYPGLFLISHEEQRVQLEISAVSDAVNFKLATWSITEGIVILSKSEDEAPTVINDTNDPLSMLDTIAKADSAIPEKTIILLRDFHLFLADANPIILRRFKDALWTCKNSNRVIVIIGCQLKMQPELEKEIVVVEYKLPDREQLRVVVEGIVKSARIKLTDELDPVLDAASGLTTTEAENAFALSIIETKGIDPKVVYREKSATIKKNNVLEIIETKFSLNDIGGLGELKQWLTKRRGAFTDAAREYGLPTPKGALVLGPPGTGKSLTAKVTANILGVPLLKLDAGRIFGSLVGESERNMRAVIQTAEAIAPCVLWIDEVEKGFAGSKSSGATDGGTTSRVFGSFLQWMQEKTASVFVVATANDVSSLPPELLRKGRFDEQWFVDLPDEAERRDIWKIQIEKRGRKSKSFKLDELAKGTAGWTGAEIEALFNEGMFAAYDANKEPDTALLLTLAKQTTPLSKMMAAQIDGLRTWADGRARRASVAAKTQPTGRKLAPA